MSELEEKLEAEERADRQKHDDKLKELREEQLKVKKDISVNDKI